MIELVHGDLLEAKTDALVNAVNCVGVMGRGIALQFEETYPEMFRAYRAVCELGHTNRHGYVTEHHRRVARRVL